MHINQLNAITALNGHKEVALLKSQLKRTQVLCKTIYKYYDYVYEIKDYIAQERLEGAREAFAELDYPVQKLLMIAPTKGGPFTTQERAIMKTLWSVTVEDLERR